MTALAAALQGHVPQMTLPHVSATTARHACAAGLIVAGVVVLVGWGWGLLATAVALEVAR